MTAATPASAPQRGATPVSKPRRNISGILRWALPLVLLAVIVLCTKVVSLDDKATAGPKTFDPASYGKETFPKQQEAIIKKAVPAAELAAALVKDPAAAAKQYGVASGTGAEYAVKFTGKVGAGESGIYPVTIAGLPAELLVRMQTGPAINGTDIRDATGTIEFGQFTNQIEYQNAASALNNELKTEVLSKIDAANLKGKTVDVVGVFQSINPKAWLVTPVKVDVK